MGDKKKYLRVALIWNNLIIEEHTLPKPSKLSIGENSKLADICIESDKIKLGENFELFQPDATGAYKINLLESMVGDVFIDDKEIDLKDFKKNKCAKTGEIYSAPIKPFDKGNIDIDDITISWGFIEEADKVLSKGAIKFEPILMNSLFFTALVNFVMIILLLLNKSDVTEISFTDIPDRFAKIVIEETEKKEEDPEVEKEKKECRKNEDIGKRAGGKEGKIGDKDTPKYIKTKLPKARKELIESDLKARGVFGALGSTLHGGGMSQLVAGDGGVGNRLAASFNGTSGDEFIAGQGSGGMGFRGTGTGGGGTGYGRIGGTGDIDTGGGRGTKVSLSKGTKGERKIVVKPAGGETFTGFCKKSDIQNVVTQKSKTISYCYEKELQRFRDLKGKVKMQWTIGTEGTVETVTVVEDTVKNSSMNECLKRQIQRWQFTKPEGGKCIIAYPFLFSPE